MADSLGYEYQDYVDLWQDTTAWTRESLKNKDIKPYLIAIVWACIERMYVTQTGFSYTLLPYNQYTPVAELASDFQIDTDTTFIPFPAIFEKYKIFSSSMK